MSNNEGQNLAGVSAERAAETADSVTGLAFNVLDLAVAQKVFSLAPCDQWRAYTWDNEPSFYCAVQRGNRGRLGAFLGGGEHPEHLCYPIKIRGWGGEDEEKGYESWDKVEFLKPNDFYLEDAEFYFGPPRYSSGFILAMKVVEKMRSDGWSFACTLYEGKLPYASFCKRTAASSRNAEAATLPEAICRAALAALEATHQDREAATT